MGKVAITYKVFPESIEVQDAVKERLQALSPAQLTEVPVFGGLNAFKVIFVREDKEGTGNLEQELKKVEGVSEVQEGGVDLIS